MAGRIRSIKPELLDDEVGAALSDMAWRLWVASWCLADDHGNLRAHGRYLAAAVWQDTSVPVDEAVDELIRTRRWEPYAVEGQRYVHIRNWERHQRIDNAGKPRVPTPESNDGTWNQAVSVRFAEILRESPRTSASLGDSPLEPSESPLDQRPTTTTTTNDLDQTANHGETKPSTRRKAETAAPASTATAEEVRAWATAAGIDHADSEFQNFVDWHRARDQRRRDWGAAWRVWKRNAKTWASARPGSVVQSAKGRSWKMPEGWE